MAKRNEFVDYLLELLAPWGRVSSRAMFGGHGIYRDGIIFGLVIDDAFYLKVDDVNRADFEAHGLGPFMYRSPRRDEAVSLGYYLCPEEALESPALMREWANGAFAVALRAAAKKTVKMAPKKMPAASSVATLRKK
ncbi:MAG: TfoX/Sxy family protein [Betaproteobacteria bacterium]|nr:TfoX/Sxy family protein [Betaproteobacteria bacterium]